MKEVKLMYAGANDKNVRDIWFYTSNSSDTPVKISGCSKEICTQWTTKSFAGTFAVASISFDNEKASLDAFAFWDYVDPTSPVEKIAFDPIADITYSISSGEYGSHYSLVVYPSA